MSKQVRALFAGVVILAVAPCSAQSKHIHEQTDPYSHLRTLMLGEVSTRACPDDPSIGPHDPTVTLIFGAFEKPDNTVEYFLTADLVGGHPLNLSRGATMDTLMDEGVGWFVTPVGSTVNTIYRGDRSFLNETIPFHVEQTNLDFLAHASNFQFRINGPRASVQRCTDAKRMRDLAEFLNAAADYGPPQLTSADRPSPLPVPPPPPAPFTEQTDPSTHLKTFTLPDIATEVCPSDLAPGLPGTDVRLAISAHQRRNGGIWYFISTELKGPVNLNLGRGGQMKLQTDRKTATFNSINGSVRAYAADDAARSVPEERTAFHLHQANLVALTNASTADFRITTPAGELHRCVSHEQLKGLAAFISLAARYEPSSSAGGEPPR